MANIGSEASRETIDEVYRRESRRILATLIRLIGDFELAEEAMQDAFASAVTQWSRDGIPNNPRAWIISVARFKAIDAIRRRAKFESPSTELENQIDPHSLEAEDIDPDGVADDDLRLIFTCCHPALAPDARIALTLREVCGLTTEEIARAFLISPPTVAQRIVRAKSKIRDARIPYSIPSGPDLPNRLDAVLQVIYLVFNEGYSASAGESLMRSDLSQEAIRLGRLVLDLLPDSEAAGLLALMLLQESRRSARSSSSGDLILLEDQDRSLWDAALIQEGQVLVQRALLSRRFGPYTIQASIAAVHSQASTFQETDWAQIAGLYGVLLRIEPSPVIELNYAVAVATREGPQAGLLIIQAILDRGELNDYYLAHSACGELYRRLGRNKEAVASYQVALGLVKQEPERRFLEHRLSSIPN